MIPPLWDPTTSVLPPSDQFPVIPAGRRDFTPAKMPDVEPGALTQTGGGVKNGLVAMRVVERQLDFLRGLADAVASLTGEPASVHVVHSEGAYDVAGLPKIAKGCPSDLAVWQQPARLRQREATREDAIGAAYMQMADLDGRSAWAVVTTPSGETIGLRRDGKGWAKMEKPSA